jgi:pectinesterase
MKKNRLLIIVLLFCYTGVMAQTSNPKQYKYVFTVAKDGTGDYNTIQDAIDAMRVYPLAPITLYIKNGTYREKIELPAPNTDVSFIGENVDSTIIVYDDYSGKGKHTTFTSYTAKISGNRFRAANISFVNSAGPVGQALALYVDADKAVFTNCKFLGNQDTIFSSGETSRQLFDHCFIEGTTDFIFGPGTAVFNACTIRSKSNSFITAASTPKGNKYGFVFLDCTITADSGVSKLSLGRPWRNYSRTVFLRCNLPAAVTATGWDNWGNPENEKTAFYAEYKNSGPGAATAGRVKWSKQLTSKEASGYTLTQIFGPAETWYAAKRSLSFIPSAFNQQKAMVVPLYTGAVPNNKAVADREKSVTSNNVTRISKVLTPTLTIYRPDKPNGQAVVICPGGGYTILAFDKEGTRVAEELNKWGVTAVVLKSRLPDDSLQNDRSLAPLQDAQEAIRYVRRHAKDWNIDARKIGIMGFSAGGHLASTAATHFNFKADEGNTDTTSFRPDFAILIYPVISFDSTITHKGSRNNLVGSTATEEKIRFFSNELQVNAQTPASFLVHAGDDGAVPVDNSVRYYMACIKNKVPAELHLYPKGGHGFGLMNQTTNDPWPERLHNWLQSLK